jgi:hypothetical protein
MVTLVLVLQEEPEWRIFSVDPTQPLLHGMWLEASADATVTWAQRVTDSLSMAHKAEAFMCNVHEQDGVSVNVCVCPIPDRGYLRGSVLEQQQADWRKHSELCHPLLWGIAGCATTLVAQLVDSKPDYKVPIAARSLAADGAGVVHRSRVFRKPLVTSNKHGHTSGCIRWRMPCVLWMLVLYRKISRIDCLTLLTPWSWTPHCSQRSPSSRKRGGHRSPLSASQRRGIAPNTGRSSGSPSDGRGCDRHSIG